jgi:hypothetical protein
MRILVLALLMAALPAAWAVNGLEEPRGKIILTVRGKISVGNSKEGAQFDLAMLEKMPQKNHQDHYPLDFWCTGF